MINWKDEVLKHYPDAICDTVTNKYTGYSFVIICDTYGAKGNTQEQAWKQTYFNIVKSAPVKSKFTKGEIVNHNDYLAHVNTFSMLRMNGNPARIDNEYLKELESKIKAYERLQPVNNANSSNGSYSISDAMFMPLENDKTTDANITASRLQEIEKQTEWLWAYVIILFTALILAVIALIKQ